MDDAIAATDIDARTPELIARYDSRWTTETCHREFVIKNADHPDWDALAKAMADHIGYRNGPRRDQRLIKAERRRLIAA